MAKPVFKTRCVAVLVPDEAPTAVVSRTWKNSAELVWKEIPLEKQRGFITHYTIIYESKGVAVCECLKK